MKRLLWFLCGDLISVMHLFFIVGMVTYDPYGQAIPPIYEMTTSEPLELVILSFCCYQVGRLFAGLVNPRRESAGQSSTPTRPILVLSVVVALVVLTVQFQTLARYGSLEAAALAKADIILENGPIARLIYVVLPFLSATLWYQAVTHIRYRKVAYVLAGLTALGLAATLFKGQLAIFAITLVYLTLCARTGAEPSLRGVVRSPLFVAAVACMIVVFLLSEGESVGGSTRYVVERAATYSWEGFAYIVETDAKPDLDEQIDSFLGSKDLPSPGLELAADMLHMDPPPIGIVVTLPGFLYRNFGPEGVGLGALLLGFIARLSLLRAAQTRNSLRTVFWIMIYFVLLEIFLVGEVFNSIRGDVLTLVALYLVLRLLERMKLGVPSPGTASESPSR